jgi:predicted transposase/invertase (TIGR01784 family)
MTPPSFGASLKKTDGTPKMQEALFHRKYARPTVDVIFKRVFGTEKNKACLISLLNAILNLEIEDLTLENTDLPKDLELEKSIRLDVLARLKTGERVDIEIQVANEGDTEKRSLFYWAKLYASQQLAGKPYSALVPVYAVFILDFLWLKKNSEFSNTFLLKNKETNENLFTENQMLQLHFIELPKFQETSTIPHSNLERWMLFLKTQNDTLLEELQMADPALNLAVSEIEVAKMTPTERYWYEAKLAGMSDEASRHEYATKLGEEKGREEGKEIGEHRERLKRLTKQSQKRFPKLSQITLEKIFVLNSEQLDQQLDLILDYNSKQEFEDAIAALPVK